MKNGIHSTRAAVHEAGHAVAQHHLCGGVAWVTNKRHMNWEINYVSDAACYPARPLTYHRVRPAAGLPDDFVRRAESDVISDFAGGVAETMFLDGELPLGDSGDLASAMQTIQYLTGIDGEGEIANRSLFERLHGQTVIFLRQHRNEVIAVANGLTTDGVLSGDRVREIVAEAAAG